MSDMEYLKMLEVPVNSCDVIIKPSKKKKKNVVEEVIDKVNANQLEKPKRRIPKLRSIKTSPTTNINKETTNIISIVISSSEIIAGFKYNDDNDSN